MQIAAIHSTSVFVIPSTTLTNNRRTDNFRLASLVPTCLNVQAAQKYVYTIRICKGVMQVVASQEVLRHF